MDNSDILQLFGTILVILGILFGDDQLIGYSFLVFGILFSLISMIIRRKRKDKTEKNMRKEDFEIEKEMRKRETEQNIETRKREKGDKRRKRDLVRENNNYKRKKF